MRKRVHAPAARPRHADRAVRRLASIRRTTRIARVSLLAMKKLRLDRVWWLVTPGNPLKDNRELPPIEERIEAATGFADHPRIDVTGFEAVIGTKYSCDTIAWLKNEARVRISSGSWAPTI